MTLDKNLTKIEGDASSRSFYIKRKNKRRSIVIYSEKNKEKNLLIYDSINKILNKNGIKAPKLLNQKYNKSLIEIEFLGDYTIHFLLKFKKKNKLVIFKDILSLLNKIQKIKTNKIKNFNNKIYKIPIYSKTILLKESELFLKWYVPKVIKKEKVLNIKKILKKEVIKLLSKLKLKNNTFVHRDFHVSNLIKSNKKIGVLDSQDALIGNRAYDLASLVDDVRLKTSTKFKKSIYNYYLKLNQNEFDIKKFRNDFDILSVLRNLKIIGIFTRLAIRDKKKKYLKLIPYAWKLIELRMESNSSFSNLKKCLDDNFSVKLRKK
tara:strand:+ start:843 stop:1802 length:960 start_codon:yes stop_codon:yes gene_type:complete